ncbi:hypothetical protein D9615_002329 [Tricholomella constricta]|uniref:Uncharacterized protein n=1 Tax=Tricholomella constricta TaxID=117010 RepID=A0A8H5HMI6_9AGAR|nr:hypothetical protein D9615_002329 [Tricholomella constricta]
MPRTRNVQPRPEPTPGPSNNIIVKRPLQDITERFVLISPAVNRVPTPKPRRKVKAPGGIFGAKLRANEPSRIPSPLPPSSPPSVSSAFLLPVPDYHIRSPFILASDGENLDSESENFEPDRYRGGDEANAEVDILNNSDPFGFFAVEKNLKALRAQQEERRPRYRAAPPPHIDTLFKGEHPVTPPTPRKRPSKRRAIASPNALRQSPRTDSMPSTPSPSKPISNKGKGKAVEILDETLEKISVTPTVASRRRPAKRENSEEAGSVVSPVKRRSVRRAVTTTQMTRGAESGRVDKGTKPRTKRGAAFGTGASAARQRSRAKGKAKSTRSSVIDENQREKWERERQERLDYFRRLQDYQVEKENVYVV